MSRAKRKTPESAYRIGAVSRLTGIASDTLRMWERRYAVVEPRRGDGRYRLYSRDDVSRLALIKRLVDAGNAISTVAALTLRQLQQRLENQLGGNYSAGGHALPTGSVRVAVFGEALPVRIDVHAGELSGLDFVAMERDLPRFESLLSHHTPEVLILELPTVDAATAAMVERLLHLAQGRRACVVYAFGALRDVRRLESDRVVALRAPIDLPRLRESCLALPPGSTAQPASEETGSLLSRAPPSARFDGQQLAHLATVSTAVLCECPHHLVDLIFGLTAFETYSQECESRNPQDAALHAYLHSASAHARSIMEDALQRLIETENLPV